MSPYLSERRRRFDKGVLAPAAEEHPCKNGHSNYYTSGGYVYCGRCGTQLWKA